MIDLSGYELIFQDSFDQGLSAYHSGAGLWSTGPRRGDLMSNGPKSVFLSDTTAVDGQKIGLNPLTVRDGALHIGAGVIPPDRLDLVRRALEQVGRGKQADAVRYYTGMISNADTWAQAYGYYEITASIPQGKGHWPAFWLAPAGIGWPPEIDIFEAYGKGLDGRRTGNDNTFTSAAFFDHLDIHGQPTQSVDWRNPHDPDKDGQPAAPVLRENQGGQQYMFQKTTRTVQEFGADLHDGSWTWAAQWTPDHIAFFFGRDRESLVEIYRTPTPEDLRTPMYVIINDQISSTWGWNPVAGLDHLTFAPDNDFRVQQVQVHALRPTRRLVADRPDATLIDDQSASQIIGSTGDDLVVTGGGAGQDFIDLQGGKDVLQVTRGTGNAIVRGFGADDLLVAEGFHFDGAQDVMARLTQVGGDVWLANGAYPADPQTIIFRDARTGDFQAGQFRVRWSVTPDVWSDRKADKRPLRDVAGTGIVTAVPGGSQMQDTSRHDGPVTLQGGAGGDLYDIHRADTIILEDRNSGVDTVTVRKDFALPPHVENLTAGPRASGITLVGNDMDNRIQGNALSNMLRGGAGDDLIISQGADVIAYARGDGADVILGFDARDRLSIAGYGDDAAALLSRLRPSGPDTVLQLEPGVAVTFRDTAPQVFSAQTFQMVPALP